MSARMPFGKYRGMVLEELPDSYFLWLVTLDLREPLASAVSREAARRGMRGSRRPELPLVDRDVAEELVGAGVRSLARKYHPDAGGRHETMTAVNVAAEWLRRQLRGLAG